MRKLIWRPRAVSRQALVLIATFALGGFFIAEHVTTTSQQPHYLQKKKAAELAKKAMDVVKQTRIDRGYPIDPKLDPTESGLIGLSYSDVTSIGGNLASKRTSINPNFAAVILDMLTELGVKEGDKVAVGVSGSFPALNICVYAAMEVMKLDPVIIVSGAASQWGANFDDFLWVDMEKALFDEGTFSIRSQAASLGGIEDRGLGMSEEGKRKVRQAIERNQLEFLADEPEPAQPDVAKSNESLDEILFQRSVQTRMDAYQRLAKGSVPRAYINIGGGTVSVGRRVGKHLFNPGINRRMPAGAGLVGGVMAEYVKKGVPVIHLVQVLEMAERYDFAIQPTTIPNIGEGNIFQATNYNKPLVSSVLIGLIGSLFAFIRSDVGFRIFKGSGKKKDEGHPEPMV